MKNLTSVLFVALLLSIISCEKDNDPSITKSGVLTGTIGLYEGNCMPVASCHPSPIATTVAITKPSGQFNIDLLVDSVVSSEDGTFEISLKEGSYSIFLRDGDEFICDSWSCSDDCYCTLVSIKNDSTTTISANIDHASW